MNDHACTPACLRGEPRVGESSILEVTGSANPRCPTVNGNDVPPRDRPAAADAMDYDAIARIS
jgi:hypothetical protein